VVLLSGGLDSATTAAIARHDGYELFALSVDYEQNRGAGRMESRFSKPENAEYVLFLLSFGFQVHTYNVTN